MDKLTQEPPPAYYDIQPEDTKLASDYPRQQEPSGGYTGSKLVVTHDVTEDEYPSNTMPMIVSCLVCWFCFCPFGCIGLYLSAQANDSHSVEEARKRIRYAYIFCIAGLAIGIALYLASTVIQITVIQKR